MSEVIKRQDYRGREYRIYDDLKLHSSWARYHIEADTVWGYVLSMYADLYPKLIEQSRHDIYIL